MILLDTNVISEIMRLRPDSRVERWLEARPPSEIATTTINLAEVRYGLARLPFGRRRRDLELRFNGFSARAFSGRVFDFDGPAAEIFGELVANRERAGRRLPGFDGLIAAIARSRALPIATRNIEDFADCGLELVSPWTAI